MPKPSSVTALRFPQNEARARALEEKTEAKQRGIAGQTSVSDVQQETSTPDVQTSTPDVQRETSTPGVQAGVVHRRGGRKRRRRTVYLPLDLDARFSEFCAGNGREVSETVAAALELYLDRK